MTPCGRTRREFLWQTGAGFTGLALASLLQEDGFFKRARASEAEDPLMPKVPHFEAKAKSVIFLFMYGGPSQVDLFDPKPELNSKHGKTKKIEVRKDSFSDVTLLGSTRKFAKHGQSGVEVSDLFPNLAKCVDDMAIVRSMYADSFAHGSAMLQMNSGSVFQGKPCLGSWVTYGLGTENRDLPSFVVLLDPRGGPIGGAPNWGAGFMPATYQGTQFRTQGDPVLNLSPRAPVTRDEQRTQLDYLAKLNATHQQTRAHESELSARIASYELAYRMQAQAPEAIDLTRESAETKSLYGMDDPKSADFGRKCLMARRMVERGVRFVQVYSGGGHNDENWDAHGDVNKNHELHCGETDKPIAGLLTDLKRRGLLDETLIVWSGEFGRMPNSQNGVGRDHNPKGFTAWMAGGGVKGGTVYGSTDEIGYAAAEDKVHVHDLHATILHLLGLDHTVLTYFHGGRDQRLTDVHGNVIRPLLA
ncbi:DUF1501 domain-containing protein [Singulisphaera sp. PoT]|uniref:DUF1501 domain-containing protein n=1 Tax=Singulisphaera sp. PoT TaxID=3411797 RepID=UPI003BF535B2